MAKISGKYEVLYIIDPAQGEEGIAALVEKFKALVEANGTLTSIDEWGKRRLAYPINYKTEGYYVLMYIAAPADLPRELERNMQIADSVLRYLVVRYEGALPAKREPLKPYTPAHTAPVQEAAAVEAPAAETTEAAEPLAYNSSDNAVCRSYPQTRKELRQS